MATWAYPQLPPDRLKLEEEKALVCILGAQGELDPCNRFYLLLTFHFLYQSQELEWLLRSLQETLVSLREGLQECAALLAPAETGSTLVLSSMRSESIKGFVTRVGTKIVKGVGSSLCQI